MTETENNDKKLTERLIMEVLRTDKPEDKKASKVEWLARLGGDVNAKIYGKSLLNHAIKRKEDKVAKVLQERGAKEWQITKEEAKVLGEKLWETSDNGYRFLKPIEELEELIKQGADIEVRGNVIGATPLWSACYHGKEDKVKLLLEHGADVNVDTDGQGGCVMAACYSARFKKTKIIDMLLEKNADVNIAGEYGWSALRHVCVKGDSEIVKKLIERGADADEKGEKRGQSLLLAVFNGHEDVVKILLEAGASLEVKNKDGSSVEDMAIMVGNKKIIDMIYEKKKNDFGMSVTGIENVSEFKSWMREQASRCNDRGGI